MKTKLLSLILLALLATTATASARSAPSKPRAFDVLAIPCGQDTRITQQNYTPVSQTTTYHVSFRAQGVGRVLFHIAPYYHWHIEIVNSPGDPTSYSFDLTTQPVPVAPTILLLDGLPAACSVYQDGITVSNVSITASAYHQNLSPAPSDSK